MKRLDQISLRQLRALDTVAREGTVTAAADCLGLTGPAVHSQLKLLEESIGSALLERDGKGPSQPTPQGRVLIEAYCEVRASLERAVHTINALDRGQIGSVVLGVVSTAKYFAPRIVARLRQEFPEVDIILKVGNREVTVAGLAKGEFDLCLMGRPPREPLCEAIPLGDNPHVLIAAADHPLAQQARVDSEALLREHFVMREDGSGTRILAMRFVEDIARGQAVRMVEMSSNETIKQAVMSGLGIAVISGHTVAEELRTGRLAMLSCAGMPIVRKWYLLSRPDRHTRPAAHKVQAWIVENSASLFPDLNL
ncbi:LysR family transcriptional regulator [Tropicimonas sp. IMCC34043]|uniref:LysR family transcriptional regulator n=1 Tax=Tropicimonas sp. IMCC34043 TaxID=2248760 RepID=UPI0018E544DB|nr:LysR family transcriptional regulator [Tropicimonas sp. IMCC34043]